MTDSQELLQKFLWLCPDDCPAKRSSLGVVSALLAISPEVAKAKMLRGGLDCRGLTALHVAVARSFPKEVVLAILEAWPGSARGATQNDCDQPPQVRRTVLHPAPTSSPIEPCCQCGPGRSVSARRHCALWLVPLRCGKPLKVLVLAGDWLLTDCGPSSGSGRPEEPAVPLAPAVPPAAFGLCERLDCP